jgi:hypothetical protein
MPRRLRIEFEGAIDHVMTRGNVRQDIVLDDDDSIRVLADLERTVHRFEWDVLALAIMSNHRHLRLKRPGRAWRRRCRRSYPLTASGRRGGGAVPATWFSDS